MKHILLSSLVTAALATPLLAQHATPGKSHAVATVTLAEAVKADGKALAPGTYEIWILDDAPVVNGVASSNVAQRVIELHQNGKLVATDVAEVFTNGERPTGTAGSPGRIQKAVVQKLRGGEYLRIAINDGGARYLIHLPTANFSEPTPQPQSPSRVEIPPPVFVVPQPAPSQP